MTKEAKIGLTGIVALVILFLGINFLKGIKLFNTQDVYYIKFSNAKALSKSSTVYADGYNIGIVSNIMYDFNHPGQVIVEISVEDGLRIPKGSSAMLDEAMLGGCTLNMLLATNLTDAYQPGDTIPGTDSNGLMSKAANMMPQLEQVVARVDTLIATLNKLTSDPNLPIIIQNAEQLTENLNKSTTQLNRLLSKDVPQMTKTFNQAGDNIVTLTDNLNKLNGKISDLIVEYHDSENKSSVEDLANLKVERFGWFDVKEAKESPDKVEFVLRDGKFAGNANGMDFGPNSFSARVAELNVRLADTTLSLEERRNTLNSLKVLITGEKLGLKKDDMFFPVKAHSCKIFRAKFVPEKRRRAAK